MGCGENQVSYGQLAKSNSIEAPAARAVQSRIHFGTCGGMVVANQIVNLNSGLESCLFPTNGWSSFLRHWDTVGCHMTVGCRFSVDRGRNSPKMVWDPLKKRKIIKLAACSEQKKHCTVYNKNFEFRSFYGSLPVRCPGFVCRERGKDPV
jgi:hypothetical protein